MYKRLFFILLLVTTSLSTHAGEDINTLQALTGQNQFLNLAEDLGAALSYKSLSSAEPSGVTGFEIGLDVHTTELVSQAEWKLASNGTGINNLGMGKLYITKGLPSNIDVEGFYTEVPSSNIILWGAALKYSILEGSMATPALAIRAAYTDMNGVEQLAFSSKSLELLLSKGFANVTPYVGVGEVWSEVSPHGVLTLQTEKFAQPKFFAGINASLLLLKLGAYVDQTGDTKSFGARIGLGF